MQHGDYWLATVARLDITHREIYIDLGRRLDNGMEQPVGPGPAESIATHIQRQIVQAACQA